MRMRSRWSKSNAIVVTFNINVQCPRDCSKIFEDMKDSEAECICKGDDRLLIRLTEDAVNPIEDFLGRNPTRSLVFSKNNRVFQWEADPTIGKFNY